MALLPAADTSKWSFWSYVFILITWLPLIITFAFVIVNYTKVESLKDDVSAIKEATSA